MNIETLYEDDDILVVNKPAGLVVHPDGRTQEPSVSEWFAERYPESRDVGEHIEKTSGEVIERHGVVHRIDRDTSGILLLAKTREGYECLKEQFKNREVEKAYHAFVYGSVKDDRGTINLPIGRSSGDFRKWKAATLSLLLGKGKVRGEVREAITYYEVLKRSPDNSPAGGWTFVEAKPKTGRTHQIRVHFQAIHHPVVADALYAASKPKLLGFERLALHARKIGFKNVQGEKIEVEAPYPEDFQKALKNADF
jgi:23S rRNA pseudouridine1911/1915/1917 synthase